MILISCCDCKGVIDAIVDAVVGSASAIDNDFVFDFNIGARIFSRLRFFWSDGNVSIDSILSSNECDLLDNYLTTFQFQHRSEDEFKDFDQVDDVARCAIDEIEMKEINDVGRMLKQSELQNDASKDLLCRLLEKNPKHRLKSLLALQRIAFFHNYNLDDVRHMKVSNIKTLFPVG